VDARVPRKPPPGVQVDAVQDVIEYRVVRLHRPAGKDVDAAVFADQLPRLPHRRRHLLHGRGREIEAADKLAAHLVLDDLRMRSRVSDQWAEARAGLAIRVVDLRLQNEIGWKLANDPPPQLLLCAAKRPVSGRVDVLIAKPVWRTRPPRAHHQLSSQRVRRFIILPYAFEQFVGESVEPGRAAAFLFAVDPIAVPKRRIQSVGAGYL